MATTLNFQINICLSFSTSSRKIKFYILKLLLDIFQHRNVNKKNLVLVFFFMIEQVKVKHMTVMHINFSNQYLLEFFYIHRLEKLSSINLGIYWNCYTKIWFLTTYLVAALVRIFYTEMLIKKFWSFFHDWNEYTNEKYITH